MSRKTKAANGAKPKLPARGRPTIFNAKLAEEICERTASREPLSKICSAPGMPSLRTVYLWKVRHQEFAENLTAARAHRADARADRIDDIMELLKAGKIDPHSARVLIDGERWQASKEQPRKYGDKLNVDTKVGIVIVKLSDEDLAL